MANKMFLKLDGVLGESTSPRHFGEIEITGWSWDGVQTLQATALGAPAGELAKNLKANLSVTKLRDKTSQVLENACLTGRKFDAAMVSVERVSERGDLQLYLAVGMTGIEIVSYSCGGNGIESVSLNFEKMEIKYS